MHFEFSSPPAEYVIQREQLADRLAGRIDALALQAQYVAPSPVGSTLLHQLLDDKNCHMAIQGSTR